MRWWEVIVIGIAGPIGGLVGREFAQGTWPTPEIREIDGLEAGAAGVSESVEAAMYRDCPELATVR